MRITGGVYKGRRVKMPKGALRPAMDRMRESMFAILGDLSENSFLDLFAGSGSVGLEAASRGAAPVFFVERDAQKKPILQENLDIAGADRTQLRIMSVESFIKRAPRSFDYVHLDPPFPRAGKIALLKDLAGSAAVHAETLITIHYPKEDDLPENIDELLTRVDLRTYGRSYLGFYRLTSGIA